MVGIKYKIKLMMKRGKHGDVVTCAFLVIEEAVTEKTR